MAFGKDDWQWQFFRDFWKMAGDYHEIWKISDDEPIWEKYMQETRDIAKKYKNDPLVTKLLLAFMNYVDEMRKKGVGVS